MLSSELSEILVLWDRKEGLISGGDYLVNIHPPGIPHLVHVKLVIQLHHLHLKRNVNT